jgi:hypothetical protein
MKIASSKWISVEYWNIRVQVLSKKKQDKYVFNCSFNVELPKRDELENLTTVKTALVFHTDVL